MTAGKRARDSAIRRLATARAEATRLGALCDAAGGTRAEGLAQHRLSAGHADVASREQWLHWVEEGESLAPWADGEWARQTVAGTAAHEAGVVGRELRNIHDRASRSRIELTQAVARSAKRVKALDRVAEVAAARRKLTQKRGLRSAQNNGSNND